LGNHRAANVVLLGKLADYLDFPTDVWDETLTARIPKQLLSLNRDAFTAGREAV
jgi:Pyruvate/2-oxoacid:ferredoxin oxidoreductase gamma subunit